MSGSCRGESYVRVSLCLGVVEGKVMLESHCVWEL